MRRASLLGERLDPQNLLTRYSTARSIHIGFYLRPNSLGSRFGGGSLRLRAHGAPD